MAPHYDAGCFQAAEAVSNLEEHHHGRRGVRAIVNVKAEKDARPGGQEATGRARLAVGKETVEPGPAICIVTYLSGYHWCGGCGESDGVGSTDCGCENKLRLGR